MNKAAKTERELLDALDRLVSGSPTCTDGALTQENLAKEAGVSRATLNRYPDVVEEFRRSKHGVPGDDAAAIPVTLQDKNRTLHEEVSLLKRQAALDKKEFDRILGAARDEIYVLSEALKERDKTIKAKDKTIAELNRRISEAAALPNGRLNAVK
ncbi:hypothetical protein [Noviherbaspirillum soli]|uniref:hypothetical protein n=1 Tax=Noviherbaspirillum soli TaxID=1064518 RepID=UPI00188C38F7|nr:hypothetical protein [Noviherbaspirillum soli]